MRFPVLTTSTLAQLDELRPHSRFDQRRFRMNVIVVSVTPRICALYVGVVLVDGEIIRRRPPQGLGKGHEFYEDNGAHTRLTRCDLFHNGELLWRIGRPQGHNEPATHFELLNQRRWDMPKCGCDDYCVERTAFRPSVITVADLDTHIVIAELFAAASASAGIISTVQTFRTRRASTAAW